MKVVLLLISVLVLSACEKAKYRSFKDSDGYFSTKKTSVSNKAQQRIERTGQFEKRDNETQEVDTSCSFPYKVRSGDSLSLVAKRCQVNMLALADANQLMPPFHLKIGQILTFDPKQVKQRKLAKSKAKFFYPLKNKADLVFVKDKSGNHALVASVAIGAEVYPIQSGTVAYAGAAIASFGNLILIKHEDGFMSAYAHNAKLLVKQGDKVTADKMIALSGATGDITEPRVYVELRYQGRKVDIKPYY